MKLFKLESYLSHKIWGGTKLVSLKNIPDFDPNVGQLPLGETWEISRHHEGKTKIKDEDKTLDEIFSEEELPYLVKFIDTSDNLSVQVHPGDEYARKFENDSGKTECWIILDAKKDQGIYLGLAPGIDKERLKKAIEENADVNKLLNFIPVKPGDFFVVEAGTIHAIGNDVLMCEVQQSSGVTYRVWDWNRLDENKKPRQLHISKAMDVINFESSKNEISYFKKFENLFQENIKDVFSHRDFNLNFYKLVKSEEISHFTESKRAISVIVFSGEILVEESSVRAYESVIIKDCNQLNVMAHEDTSFIIVS